MKGSLNNEIEKCPDLVRNLQERDVDTSYSQLWSDRAGAPASPPDPYWTSFLGQRKFIIKLTKEIQFFRSFNNIGVANQWSLMTKETSQSVSQ